MTRDEILAMKPSREFDAQVAGKAMGWSDPIEVSMARSLKSAEKWFTAYKHAPAEQRLSIGLSYKSTHVTRDGTKLYCGRPFDAYSPKPYSTSIAAAHKAEERIKEIGKADAYTVELFFVVMVADNPRKELRTQFDLIHASPEQRTKAALLAVMEI